MVRAGRPGGGSVLQVCLSSFRPFLPPLAIGAWPGREKRLVIWRGQQGLLWSLRLVKLLCIVFPCRCCDESEAVWEHVNERYYFCRGSILNLNVLNSSLVRSDRYMYSDRSTRRRFLKTSGISLVGAGIADFTEHVSAQAISASS